MKLTAQDSRKKSYREIGKTRKLKRSLSALELSALSKDGSAISQAMSQRPDQIDSIEAYQRQELVKNLNSASQDPFRSQEAIETARALAELQDPNTPRSLGLESFARFQENAHQPKNSTNRSESGAIHVGKICFDGSSQEAEVFKQLFKIINDDRAGLGKWLWYLGDETTLDTKAMQEVQRTDINQPERIKKTQWTIQNLPIKSAKELQCYMRGKSKDASKRAFYAVFQESGKDPGKVVGCMSFGGSGKKREMHWWVSKQHRGQGIMQEAHARAAEYLYNEGVETLFSSAEVENAPSRGALRKLYTLAGSSTSQVQAVWSLAWKNEKFLSTDIEYSATLKNPMHGRNVPPAKDIVDCLNILAPSKDGQQR